MSHHDDVYADAEAYDIAFDFRDVVAECDALEELVIRRLGRKPEAVLELAAGPARHASEFARRGLRAAALDASPEMVEYGRARSEALGAPIRYELGDMTAFRMAAGSFDLVLLLMDSASYLLDNEAVARHLRCVARVLAPGGLCVLELAHPRDVFGTGSSTITDWNMERDGKRVHTSWGQPDDPFDPITQIRQVTVRIDVTDPEGTRTILDRAPLRCFTCNELKALVGCEPALRLVELWGAMDLSTPFDNEKAAWRMVGVVERVAPI